MSSFNSVLLIDDDHIANYLTKIAVESSKITDVVLVAKNGEEALQLLINNANIYNALPELILVDLNMPIMDGFEFIKQFKITFAYHNFPTTIVALTNSTHSKDYIELKKIGVEFCLTKPLSREKLENFLKENSLPNVLKKPLKNTFAVPVIPPNEVERLKEVRKYNIYNTAPEQRFDTIVERTAKTFNTPISLLSIVEEEKVFAKANWGAPGAGYVDRGTSLCSLAILQNEVTVFPDAIEDPCLLANPIIHGNFGVRFYAGAPICNNWGYQIGALCIIDQKPRTFSEADKLQLQEFASQIMQQIEERLEELTKANRNQ